MVNSPLGKKSPNTNYALPQRLTQIMRAKNEGC